MNKIENVLSLFDGMSAGQMALIKSEIKIKNYYASEVDKYAIQIAMKNFPNTIQLGDINNWRNWNIDWSTIDVVIGGSPCQGFSFAGRQLNFEDPRSKLFFVFLDICNHVADHNPKMKFLLENVKMKKEFEDVISEKMGVKPVLINSALVSAQNRRRLYWTNICKIEQPEDKGIMLKDIVHEFSDSDLSKNELNYMLKSSGKWSPSTNNRFETYLNYPDNKHHCLTANLNKGVPYNCFFQPIKSYVLLDSEKLMIDIPEATKKGSVGVGVGVGVDLTFLNSKTRRGRLMDDKSNCLTAANYDYGIVECLSEYIVPFEKTLQIIEKEVQRGKVGFFRKDSQANRVYFIHDKAVTLCGDAGGGAAKMGQYLFGCITPDRVEKRQNGQRFNDGKKFYTLTAQDKHGVLIEGYIRKLTPIECERLQTFPDNYSEGVSNSQRYKMLGNGWTVDVISHIFNGLKS